MIQLEENLPNCTFQLLTDEGMQSPTTEDLFAGKKVVLFAVPGAFTPTCSEEHLPGYVTLADKIKAKGVDNIICLAVNDAFVMNAWGKVHNADEITMLADGAGDFTKAIGLDMDTGAFGGLRSQRYSMLVEDGCVTQLNIEPPKTFGVSKAETMLALL